MSVLTDLIYGGSNAVAGLTEGAVNDAIAKYGEDKKVAMPPTPFIPSSTQRQSNPPIPIEGDPYPTMKIGKIANEILRERLSQGISEQELIHLQKAEYSKQFLGINYPLLAKNRYVDDRNGIPHSRYYAEQVIINGSYFYLCSEWYKSDRPYLLKWLQDH